MEKIIIEQWNASCFCIYDAAGHAIEVDFPSYRSAELWARDNGYEVVKSFNLTN